MIKVAPKPTPIFSVRMPPKMRAELEKEAADDSRTLSSYVLKVLGERRKPGRGRK